MSNEILLESGTNEVEILEFYLGEQGFGINIAKVAQIIPFDRGKLTVVPGDNPAIIGNLLWQNQIIPLINLDTFLGQEERSTTDRSIVLVTEFNGVKSGFLTDGVNRIHRVSWEQIDPLSSLLVRYTSSCTGSIHMDQRDILLVDFEFIIASLYPETSVAYHNITYSQEQRREQMQVVFAEDSSFIRQTILKNLKSCGYINVKAFENGHEASVYIQSCNDKVKGNGGDIRSMISILVTDIEMPKMDGLALCKQLKIDMNLSNIPVIVFSSLINKQMEHKCREVGANAYMTKPRITELVKTMDSLLGLKE